jgi:hypothetical protein
MECRQGRRSFMALRKDWRVIRQKKRFQVLIDIPNAFINPFNPFELRWPT